MNITRFGIVASLWALALYGGLQLNRLDLGHSICGPWGCGPPTSALLAVHTGWLLAILPLAILLPQLKSNWPWKMIGAILLASAAVTVVGVGFADHLGWRKLAGDRASEYAWQRFCFHIATLYWFPMVQVGLLGAAMTFRPRKPRPPTTQPPTVPVPAESTEDVHA